MPLLDPSPGRINDYKELSGPCLVFEGKDWSMRCGRYKDDAAAEKEAARAQKKAESGTKIRAGRWEEDD